MNQMHTLIFKCLLVVLLTEYVTTFEDVNLNNLDFKTVTSLLKILGKHKNDVKYIIIQPNKWKPKENHAFAIDATYTKIYDGMTGDTEENKRFARPGNHILIKRLLPHGLPPLKLEFDSKYKTYYRPLVRVHKRKVLPKIGTILNIDGNSNGLDKYGIDLYDYVDNDENVLKFATKNRPIENLKSFKIKEATKSFDVDEEMLQPFATNFKENYQSPDEVSTHLTILEDIQKLLKKIRSRPTKMKMYNDITRVLDKMVSLRSHQKSGEENDPMAPGKPVTTQGGDVQQGPQKPKKWIKNYPPWNFWTYQKLIYQDACPEGQVKIANLCIWVPPH